MFRLVFSILLSLNILIFANCSNNPVGPYGSDIITSDSTVTIGIGQKALILPDSLMIEFGQLLEDSRCPYDVECFWEGRARIGLRISKPGEESIDLESGVTGAGRCDLPIDNVFGYEIQIASVDPYPASINDQTPEIEYSTTLTISPASGQYTGSVIISDLPPSEILLDHFYLLDYNISNDTAYIRVEYSGGCQPHNFSLYMSPWSFVESDTMTARLYLKHDANGDQCRALIEKELVFYLRPIAFLYESNYGDLDPIKLFLCQSASGPPYSFRGQTYYPELSAGE